MHQCGTKTVRIVVCDVVVILVVNKGRTRLESYTAHTTREVRIICDFINIAHVFVVVVGERMFHLFVRHARTNLIRIAEEGAQVQIILISYDFYITYPSKYKNN